jgi:signal transduction histidine kinase
MCQTDTVPVDVQVVDQEARSTTVPESFVRWFSLWDSYFVIAYLITVVLLFVTPSVHPARIAIAMAALTLMVPLYAGLGRALMSNDGAGWRNVVFACSLSTLFLIATAADLACSFALFAVVPMLMMSLPPSAAISIAILANLTPFTIAWLGGGSDSLSILPITLLGIALSALLGQWITRVVRQSKERAELIKELHRNREQLARFSHEAGIAAERERLAREIHDTLAQGLTSIISLVEAAESELDDSPGRAHRHLNLAGEAAKESLSEARDFVAALTPATLRDGSLSEAVRRQGDMLARQTGLTVHSAVGGTEQLLPMAIQVVLLRTTQEALANIRKHANAELVDLILYYAAGEVRLVVTDDGQGFGPSRPDAGGFGLPGMRARVAKIGGTTTVTASPGEGTTIEVTVPLEGDPAEVTSD